MSYERTSAPALTHEALLERRKIVADHYGERVYRRFKAIPDIEGMKDAVAFAALSTAGTILQPAVDALTEAGITVEPTMGGVMGALGLSQHEVHELACECHGDEVTGAIMERRFESLVN